MLDKKIAFLEYNFMFDPTETWSNLYQFEATLGNFFENMGMDVQIVKTIEGIGSKRIFIITKKALIQPEPHKNSVGRPQSVGSKFKEMADRKLKAPALAFQKKK